MDEVRKSMARISFDWRKPLLKPKPGGPKFEKKNIVIPGILVSIERTRRRSNMTLIVDGTFFDKKVASQCTNKILELPTGKGYEKHDSFDVIDTLGQDNYLCALKLRGVSDKITEFMQPIKFETQLVGQGGRVHTFVFPAEAYMTPTAYCPGCVIDAYDQLVVHGCHIHEYAQFGSPLLNESGNLIGICCGSQGHTQSFSVSFLEDYFNISDIQSVTRDIIYLVGGAPRPVE